MRRVKIEVDLPDGYLISGVDVMRPDRGWTEKRADYWVVGVREAEPPPPYHWLGADADAEAVA